MLGRGGRPSSRLGEVNQPLLNSSREDLSASATNHSDILFLAQDDDDFEHSALDVPDSSSRQVKLERSVRFQEDVQVMGPPLRSTFESRETGVVVRFTCSSGECVSLIVFGIYSV